MSSTRKSRLALGLALAGTLGASWWALGDESGDELVAPRALAVGMKAAQRPATASSAALVDASVPSLPQRRYVPVEAGGDLFVAFGETVRPAAPAPTATAPVAAASAPELALPYGFAGRLVTSDRASVLLNEGVQTHVLAVGAALGDFRLTDDKGAELDFVHVPTGTRLVLPTGP